MTSTSKKICMITITHGLSPTSMPYNEFILYRLKHYPAEKQICVVLFESKPNTNISYPDEVEIFRCPYQPVALHKFISRVFNDYSKKGYEIVFHIHECKSAVWFTLATFGKYYKHTVYTLHSTFSRYPLHNKILSFLATLFSYRVVCCSKTSYKYFPALLIRLFPHKISFIQNGLDTERVDKSYKQKEQNTVQPNTPFRLIYVARLVALKQHEILFNALTLLPASFKLILVGVGKREKELKNLVKTLGLEKQVQFLGQQPREKVYQLLQESDAYVSSSSYEGLPIGVLEAMACATPCLVSDIEQHREIAEKCPSLILVKNDAPSWAAAIKKLAESAARYEFGQRNREEVCREFSLIRMHEQYDKIYQEVA